MNTFELEMNALGDCYSHSYLPLKWVLSHWGDPKVCRLTTASLVALNWSSRPSKQKKVSWNFCLLTVARVQYSGCGLTNIPYIYVCKEKLQKLTNEHARHLWRQFRGRSSPVVAHTPPRPRKGRCPVAAQSFGVLFGVCNIHIHTIVFDLSSSAKEERKEERRKERKMNKIEIFTRG